MKHIAIILSFAVLVSAALIALGGDAPAVDAAPAPVPAIRPSAQTTQTCSLTMTWKYREDHTSYSVSSFTSSWTESSFAGTQSIQFAIKTGNNPSTQWTDVFSVTGITTGMVITLTASGDLPQVNAEPVGGDTQPPQLRCYYGAGLSTSGARINNYQSVFTSVTNDYHTCSVGHYPWEGREASTYWPSGHTYSYAYYLSFSQTICGEECGSVFTNTHFIQDAGWVKGGSSWTSSEYHLPAGSTLSRAGSFTSDAYNVAVQAKSASGAGVLSIGLGESTQAITVTGTSYGWYTGTFAMGITGTLNLTMTAAGEQIDLHQICINPTTLASSCYVLDWHFQTSTEWIPQLPYAVHEPSVWVLSSGGYIYQNMTLSRFNGRLGPYYFQLRAKATAASDVNVMVNEIAGDAVNIATTDYAIYSGTIDIPNEPNLSIKIDSQSESAVTVDYLCLYPFTSVTPDGTAPCGLTQTDVDHSARYIINGGFDQINKWPFPECSITLGYPLGFSINCSLIEKITAYSWHGSLTGLGSLGVARTGWNGLGWSVGIVPLPLNNGMYQNINNSDELSNGYNVVFRMRRMYANSQLNVGFNINVNDTPVGEWTDKSVYQDGTAGAPSNLLFTSSCYSGMCTDPIAENTPDAVQVDSIYIVPGPEMTCGVVVTNPVTPPGGCINPSPTFDDLTSWDASADALISDGEAIIPSGDYIQQMVPLSDGTIAGNAHGLQVGQSYSLTLSARAQNLGGNAASISVVVGASTPGSTVIGTASVSSQSLPEVFTYDFTLSADMLSNGSAMPLRILSNESGGTVIVYYVCIRNEGGITQPPGGGGSCLGVWSISNGGFVYSTTIEPPAYVFNYYEIMPGSTYYIHAVGSFSAAPNPGRLTIMYFNPGGASPSIDVDVGQNFDVSRSFVAPSLGGEGIPPEVRIYANGALEYSELCMTQNTGVPPVSPPPSPQPYPQCSSILGDPAMTAAKFFHLPQYQITPEYSGTLDSAAYAAELIYNYGIYPLACTELSIANWQYWAYHGLLSILENYANTLWAYLQTIIDLLGQIRDRIGNGGGGGLSDLLLFLLEILKLLIELLMKILDLIFGMFVNVISKLMSIGNEFKSESAVTYEIGCSGDAQWFCLGLSSLLMIDESYGDWLNIVANLAVVALTFTLIWWAGNQLRALFQPESSGSGQSE